MYHNPQDLVDFLGRSKVLVDQEMYERVKRFVDKVEPLSLLKCLSCVLTIITCIIFLYCN
jgi:hypothetical protein